jgi:GxxExxY protein
MLFEDEYTNKIIGAAQEVHRELGFGFLEAVYGNALFKELTKRGLKCECQKPIDVFYKGEVVGHSLKVKRKLFTKGHKNK